jgi:hypothetical protein
MLLQREGGLSISEACWDAQLERTRRGSVGVPQKIAGSGNVPVSSFARTGTDEASVAPWVLPASRTMWAKLFPIDRGISGGTRFWATAGFLCLL